ncbi:MAG: LysR family transcriptional regulator [Proteobacteria bacterium]|nr:LysR family transcriptional regulator [Pseudomonadota bacterium]
MNWDDVDAFCSVIEHGGFTAAARALGRPKSSVSASVARLEAQLNARLLQRTTRRVSPTEAGSSLYQDVGPTFERLREIQVEAMSLGSEVAGTLRIAAPYEFGAHHVGEVANAMLKAYPALRIDVEVEHAHIDPLDRRYDIVFSMIESALPASGTVARRVFSLPRGVYASPGLLAQFGTPDTPEALSRLPLIASLSETHWPFADPAGTGLEVPVAMPRMRSSNAAVRRRAALDDLGVARITQTFCAEAVREGSLVRLLPGYECAPLKIYALLPGRRLMPPKVRVFLDALSATETG